VTPAWTNWEQFAGLNEEETKRAEENRRLVREAEDAEFQRMTGDIQTAAIKQAEQRGFGGIQNTPGYEQLKKRQESVLRGQRSQPAAAPWEQHVGPKPDSSYRNPWMDLEQRLGQIEGVAKNTETNYRNFDRQNAAEAAQIAENKRLKLAKQEQDKKAAIERDVAVTQLQQALKNNPDVQPTYSVSGGSLNGNWNVGRPKLLKLIQSGVDPANWNNPAAQKMLLDLGFNIRDIQFFVRHAAKARKEKSSEPHWMFTETEDMKEEPKKAE
jgi:hypothetical protein